MEQSQLFQLITLFIQLATV